MNVKKTAEAYRDYIVGMRREFHRHPEVSMKEYRTSKRIREELAKAGIAFEVVGETGVVATIKGGKPGKTVALRADIDALSVKEETGVDYASENDGFMHACGHDGHASMLLGAAMTLNDVKADIAGTVKLCFQPGEEVAMGAKMLVEAGVLDGVDGCFAIHLWADIPTGKVSVEKGPRMASADVFEIEVTGRGGHGSMPHQGVDAVVAASAIVMNMQSIVSRETNPLESAVVSIGTIGGGARFNVIAENVKMTGTTRTFSPKIWAELPAMMERIAKSTAAAYRAQAHVDYKRLTQPVINDSDCSTIAEGSVTALLGEDGLGTFERVTGGEDFSEFMTRVPGVIALVGIRNEEKGCNYPHHHSKFQIDEAGLLIGASLYAQYAVDFLDKYGK